MWAYEEESHCRQKSIRTQNHPPVSRNQFQMEDLEYSAHIPSILAKPRC